MEKEKVREIIRNGRQMLKPDWDYHFKNGDDVDGNQGLPPLPVQKPFDSSGKLIDLTPFGETTCGNQPLPKVIADRHSTRKYAKTPITLEEVSYLLWATQGIKEFDDEWGWAKTVIPSAGMTHCLETYVYISSDIVHIGETTAVQKGIYRYLPIQQKLIEVNMNSDVQEKLNIAMHGQLFGASLVFLWTAYPYKLEYGYGTVAHKMVAIEAGHVCQNLYLAAESINCGCCAISAYYQDQADILVGADGEEEFVIYMATVGKYTEN